MIREMDTQMDDLVERVARAICEELFGPYNVEEFPHSPSCPSEQSRNAARAAIEAMRGQVVPRS